MTSLCLQALKLCASSLSRKYHPIRYSTYKGAYEGDGKTTVTILNKLPEYGLMIDAISCQGFTLNLGITILGAILMFPRTAVSWSIGGAHEINRDSLVLLKVVTPRPDIVILGLDNVYPRDAPFIIDFHKIMKEWGISYEVLLIDRACQAFNFLNAENRYVVGAFLPPADIKTPNKYQLEQRALRQNLLDPNENMFP